MPYALLIVGTFTASGWFFYHTTQEALSRELTKRLLTVAQTVRSVMNPRHLSQMTSGSETTTLYTLMLSDLKRLQTASNASHIYIIDQDHRTLVGRQRTDADRTGIFSDQLDSVGTRRSLEGTPQGIEGLPGTGRALSTNPATRRCKSGTAQPSRSSESRRRPIISTRSLPPDARS